LEKPNFSGKVQATNQATNVADTKPFEEVKVDEVKIEKPNFIIASEGQVLEIDRNSDVGDDIYHIKTTYTACLLYLNLNNLYY